MPALDEAQLEDFVQRMERGESPTAAYCNATHQPNSKYGAKIARSDAVVARREEIRTDNAEIGRAHV